MHNCDKSVNVRTSWEQEALLLEAKASGRDSSVATGFYIYELSQNTLNKNTRHNPLPAPWNSISFGTALRQRLGLQSRNKSCGLDVQLYIPRRRNEPCVSVSEWCMHFTCLCFPHTLCYLWQLPHSIPWHECTAHSHVT